MSDSDEKTLMPNSGSGSEETLPGSALGTPGYMSPEGARGDLNRLGPRSDIYSLGATLYCLLTGRPPFDGDDVAGVLRKVQWGEFTPPRQLDSGIDPSPGSGLLKGNDLCAESAMRQGGPSPMTLNAGRRAKLSQHGRNHCRESSGGGHGEAGL